MTPGAAAVQWFACPTCKVAAGARCVTASGASTGPHIQRWRLGEGWVAGAESRQAEVDQLEKSLGDVDLLLERTEADLHERNDLYVDLREEFEAYKAAHPDTPPVVTPPPPPAEPRWTGGYGMFEDLQYLTGTALNKRLDEYQATGVQWARFQLLWARVQSGGASSYYWKPIDDLIAGLTARGIKALAVLGTTPGWAARSAGCTSEVCAPADPAQFAVFARKAAERYAPLGVHAWEVWNEPNSSVFWKPSPSVKSYTAVLRATYAAIKAVDPDSVVLTGGVAPAATTSWSIAPLDFLAGIYANGGQGYFDAVGWHPYCYPRMPGTVNSGDAWYQMYGPANSARAQMVAAGDGGKQIWSTEFGAHTDPAGQGYVSEAQQAETFATGLRLWKSYPWAGPMIGYQYRDRGTNTADRENFFGLTRYDGTPKPAYRVFADAAHAFPV